MDFISLKFVFGFFIFLYIYYMTRAKYRYIIIFLAGSIFYFLISPEGYIALSYCVILTYVGGYILNKWRKKGLFITLFLMDIFVLCLYKYFSFISSTLSDLFEYGSVYINNLNLIIPVGISFFIFQSSTYLGDIYNGKITIEKNFIRYASFVMFFPTILSGPIQKSRDILPQLKDMDSRLNDEGCIKGFCLLLYGLFVKLIISVRKSMTQNFF